MMTACDLCAMFKPWDIQQSLVYIMMEEFWEQVIINNKKCKKKIIIITK